MTLSLCSWRRLVLEQSEVKPLAVGKYQAGSAVYAEQGLPFRQIYDFAGLLWDLETVDSTLVQLHQQQALRAAYHHLTVLHLAVYVLGGENGLRRRQPQGEPVAVLDVVGPEQRLCCLLLCKLLGGLSGEVEALLTGMGPVAAEVLRGVLGVDCFIRLDLVGVQVKVQKSTLFGGGIVAVDKQLGVGQVGHHLLQIVLLLQLHLQHLGILAHHHVQLHRSLQQDHPLFLATPHSHCPSPLHLCLILHLHP